MHHGNDVVDVLKNECEHLRLTLGLWFAGGMAAGVNYTVHVEVEVVDDWIGLGCLLLELLMELLEVSRGQCIDDTLRIADCKPLEECWYSHFGVDV